MKGLIIIIVGLVLFAGGLINIQNQYYGFIACFCGGALIGTGIAKTLRSK
tara:strand:+ start:792 stop:941 length:150 start_codon:yes stop_codon:yes gene_type:complete